jgi:probable phosphoglycerate mutase
MSNDAGDYTQRPMPMPPGSTRLLLIRHGSSEAAREDRPFELVEGQDDPALSPGGILQAERVADRLAKTQLDALYVSTLCRTSQTAAPLAQLSGLTPRVERDIREVSLGDWEGGEFRRRAAANDPIFQRMLAEERWDVVPGAEPAEAFSARVRAALERIAAAHIGQQVAVFSHGGVIAQSLALATGSRPFAFLGVDNASISNIIVTGPHWMLRGYNDTAHLDPSFTGAAPL